MVDMKTTQKSRRQPSSGVSAAAPGQHRLSARILDLVALLALVAVTAVVFLLGGPNGAVVVSVGAGLYATWKAGQPDRSSGPSDGR